jgi:lysophospholipase L1-like esterase
MSAPIGWTPGGSTPPPAPQYYDQAPALNYGVVSGNGMQALWQAIANRNNARCDIPIIGDSVTMGYGVTSRAASFPQQLNRAVRARFPTVANGSAGGLGFIPIQVPSSGSSTFTWDFTPEFAGASTADVGPVRMADTASSVQFWTWTAPAGTTSVRIVYYDASAAGSFNYKVNSGSATVVSNTLTSAELLTASIPITVGQVLTITWVSGYVVIDGIQHFAGDENSGITFHQCGHAGWTAANSPTGWNQGSTFGNVFQTFKNGFTNTQALMFQLGFNDSGVYNAASFATYMEQFITNVRASTASLNNIPVILLGLYQPDLSIVDPNGWSAYVASLRSVAAVVGNAMVVDLNYRMNPFAASGTVQYDVEHPNALGSALIGELISASLGLG